MMIETTQLAPAPEDKGVGTLSASGPGEGSPSGWTVEALRRMLPELEGPITNRRIRDVSKFCRQTISTLLSDLVAEGKLVRIGHGRGVVYYSVAHSSKALPPNTAPSEVAPDSPPAAHASAPAALSQRGQNNVGSVDRPALHNPRQPSTAGLLEHLQGQQRVTEVRRPSPRGCAGSGQGSAALAASERRQHARQRILQLVTEIDTVRDLTTTVPLPRRTLQRVLSAMLQERALEAEGATRKRRYFLPATLADAPHPS